VRVRAAYERPVRFAFGPERWRVPPRKLGATPDVDGAIAQALAASPGETISLSVRLSPERIRAYVEKLNRRLFVAPQNAELAGLVDLQPSITEARAGREVRQGLMSRAIASRLRSTVRRPLPVTVRELQPEVTKAEFGPVVVIRPGANELRFYEGEQLVRTFPVATGQSQYPTPLGTWSVVDKQMNPWWRPPDSDWAKGLKPIPPGPGNPLGTRWMGLSAPGVGIHGTPDAASIGYSASHGCIRMYIPDATWLFGHVDIGTPVVITAA
jgi:lipoprotein-anchoring transpeptidase ErfK/SrfK